MQRVTLERRQVWVYLTAIALGLAAGSRWPSMATGLDVLLSPTLALLLYATFVQVPLLHVRDAFGDRRFVVAVVVGNFLLLQLISLPPWLWLMAGADSLPPLSPAALAPAAAIVVLPLLLAAFTERWIEARPGRDPMRERLAWWPVPLLAAVVFQIAAAQVGTVLAAGALLQTVVPVFIVFLLAAGALARPMARGRNQRRISTGTSLSRRRLLVMLPSSS